MQVFRNVPAALRSSVEPQCKIHGRRQLGFSRLWVSAGFGLTLDLVGVTGLGRALNSLRALTGASLLHDLLFFSLLEGRYLVS